jgi:hypothetical protein
MPDCPGSDAKVGTPRCGVTAREIAGGSRVVPELMRRCCAAQDGAARHPYRERIQIQLAFSSREPYFPRMVLTESVSEPLKQNQSPDATGIPAHPDQFVHRHIGPNAAEAGEMLASTGFKNLDELIAAAVPENIRLGRPLQLPAAKTESEALASLKALASQNQVFRSQIGMGYYDCITPAGHPAQRSRKSRLVHAIHAVSGRDFPGPARSAAEFSDDGRRPHRSRYRQCLAAGRGHRRPPKP